MRWHNNFNLWWSYASKSLYTYITSHISILHLISCIKHFYLDKNAQTIHTLYINKCNSIIKIVNMRKKKQNPKLWLFRFKINVKSSDNVAPMLTYTLQTYCIYNMTACRLQLQFGLSCIHRNVVYNLCIVLYFFYASQKVLFVLNFMILCCCRIHLLYI